MRAYRNEDLRRLAALVRDRDGAGLACQLALSVGWRAQRRFSHRGEHRFVDRSRGSEQMLVVLAGHKPYLWPYTLARLERVVPEGVDVCIVSPGVAPPELGALAERCGWSWLTTRRNALSLAQNLAIARHPRARLIHKLDEDVFVGRGYFERLVAGYGRVKDEGRFTPGFAAPVLNVNGFSYRLFLEELGLQDEYERRFGELRQACVGVAAHGDGEAARWLWERSLPFDDLVARFADRPFGYVPVPHRFSIGALVMERDLWEAVGGFPSHPTGDLGHDERHLCVESMDRSRVPVVLLDVLAGHFSFGPQEATMREALPALRDGLLPPARTPAEVP